MPEQKIGQYFEFSGTSGGSPSQGRSYLLGLTEEGDKTNHQIIENLSSRYCDRCPYRSDTFAPDNILEATTSQAICSGIFIPQVGRPEIMFTTRGVELRELKTDFSRCGILSLVRRGN